MWRNYLTVGCRALVRSKVHAAINLFGLSVGLAACILILLYVRYETSYDAWLPDSDRIFQVQSIGADPDSPDRQVAQGSPGPMAQALAKDFPQIEAASRMEYGNPVFLKDGEPVTVKGFRLVDEPFFDILQVPFLRGDSATALDDTDSLVLSRSEAMRLFGSVDIVGRTITQVQDGEKRDARVTGVFEDLPKNSHMAFTMVARHSPAGESNCGWSCINGDAYVKLRRGVDVAAINAQMPAFEKRNVTPESIGGALVSEADRFDWRLANVRDVHLGEAQDMADRPGNDMRTIATFAIVALLILGMAVVNFTNLATARAGQRAREVALRKVLGASRRQLIGQFLGESLLLTAAAMIVALTLVELTLPAYSAFLDADLRLNYQGEGGILLPAAILLLVVGLAGGLYPAFYLSRFRPALVLKANRSTAETPGSGRLRSLLVVAQFAVSIGLIACTAIVYQQTVFARTVDPGFKREGLLLVENVRRPEINRAVRDTLIGEIEKVDGVTSVSGTQIVPGTETSFYTMVQVPGRPEPVKIDWYSIEPSFFETMDIGTIAGRKLSEAYANDSALIDYASLDESAWESAQRGVLARGLNIVVNAQGARHLGFTDPQAALGKQIRIPLFGEELGMTAATIVGVTQNTRFRSIREPVEPMIFYTAGSYTSLAIRYRTADALGVRKKVAQVWKRLLPELPLQLVFSDEKLAELYVADARRGQAFAAFAALAILIACLGLFGLAAFTTERRTKEIGIRKVFGATVPDIVQLLAWQFSKPVIIANLIAWPVAWWVMRDWLNSFDARVDLGPGPFLVAGLLALAIAVGTVAGQAVRVARLNPVHALRYE